jgi:competence protein ComEC
MKHIKLITSLVLVTGLVGIWFLIPFKPHDTACRFTALNVGQGDAILIRTPDQQDILIDGGPDDSVIAALERNMPLGDNDLELVIATHSDSDHLYGLTKVADKYEIRMVLENGLAVNTKTYRNWKKLIASKQIVDRLIRRGQIFTIGKYFQVQILWPDNTVEQAKKIDSVTINDFGVVTKISCAGSTALMMADVTVELEQKLAKDAASLTASLLKIGHHGSKYSTSPELLAAVRPNWALISVGENNFGHPSPIVLQRLTLFGIEVRRTDRVGDIKLRSDGSGGWR